MCKDVYGGVGIWEYFGSYKCIIMATITLKCAVFFEAPSNTGDMV